MKRSNGSELEIVKQESLAQGKLPNGRQGKLHFVAKSLAFTIEIKSPVTLHKNVLSAKLTYDQDGSEVVVPQHTGNPMEFTIHVSSDDPHIAVIECRVKVLSSQQNGALFRIRVTVANGKDNFVTESEPIKILSRRSQAEKLAERQKAHTKEIISSSEPAKKKQKQTHSDSASEPTSPESTPTNQSGYDVDIVAESLRRMEQQQELQFGLLKNFFASRSNSVDSSSFEDCFGNLLASFERIPASERAATLQRIVSTLDTNQFAILSHFINLLISESVSDQVEQCAPFDELPMEELLSIDQL
jgi:hypothetical protein